MNRMVTQAPRRPTRQPDLTLPMTGLREPLWADAANGLWDDDARARYEPALRSAGVMRGDSGTLLARESPRPGYGAHGGAAAGLHQLLDHLEATVTGLLRAAEPVRGPAQALWEAEATRRAILRLDPALTGG